VKKITNPTVGFWEKEVVDTPGRVKIGRSQESNGWILLLWEKQRKERG